MFQEQSDCGGWNMEQIELEAKLPPSSTHASSSPSVVPRCGLWSRGMRDSSSAGRAGRGEGQRVKFGQRFAAKTEPNFKKRNF